MNFMAVLFVLVCVVLILVILIQKGRGGGLSGAFGGGGMAGSLLGSKTGDFLTWVTIVLVGVFLLLAVILARFYRPAQQNYGASSAPVTSSSTAGQAEMPATEGLGNEGLPAETEAGMAGEPTESAPVETTIPLEPNSGSQ